MAEVFSKVEPASIIAIARTWIGTPYKHQSAVKLAGTDCLGVLRGVYEELYGKPSEVPPPYRPDWYDANKDDVLLRKAFEYLEPLANVEEAKGGDVLVFRMRPRMAAKHVAIITEDGRMVHAKSGTGVEEVTINHWYEKRIVAAFRFPGVK